MQGNLMAFADSLGWALLHSIWQVAAIAGIVFLLLRILPKENAQLRHATAYLGIIGSALAFMVTFGVYFSAYGTASVGLAAAASVAEGPAAYIEMVGSMTWLISLCWAIGFAMLSKGYVEALRATHRLRSEGVSQVPEEWEQRFRLWIERLGADATTVIRYSQHITTPVTIGVLKPMILVPTGFFLRMPSEQAEAVLVHEIAHICRQDYLLGLVQSMIVNIFFFHPAIHYLAHAADAEREFACDARATQETGDATALARGLSQIALDSQEPLPGFAMAALRKSPLMDRLNRLADRPARRDRGLGTPLAGVSMVFAASLMIAIGADASTGPKAAESDKGDDIADTGDLPATTSDIEEFAALWPDEDAPSPGWEVDQSALDHTTREDARMITVSHRGVARPAVAPTAEREHSEHRTASRNRHRVIEIGSDDAMIEFAFSGSDPGPIAAAFTPTVFEVRRSEGRRKSTANLVSTALATAAQHREEECPDDHADRRRDAREYARRAERRAREIERRMERRAREIERQAERIAERAERHAERVAANAARHAEIDRMVEREVAQLEERMEREAERIEREIERWEREHEERRERHGRAITISFSIVQPAPIAPAPPAAPRAPAAPSTS